ncbi:SF-assemblin/beta giardin-domain-containing protein [Pelagophyceae sp. CCMP2097]|nr:SF-assemblin/beta giardin-domain-containing protein [Pelagophyceae sp. CCMP2097]|mmetsp:Transcript_10823/g.36080  ORF Transcript_10823/g.36080 Transcript_10823/m.36080 type:complete len:262 (-) Transcript_10823:12-797(-)
MVAPMADVMPAQSTGKRLGDILSSFDSFDADMRVGTRQRREKDEFKVFQMQEHMSALERRLETEMHRRSEVGKSMAKWCDKQIDETRASMRSDVAVQQKELQARVDALKERLSDMQQRFAVDIEAIPLDIEQRGRELAARLKHSMEDFEGESASRLDREAAMNALLADQASDVAKRFDSGRTQRQAAYVDNRNLLDDHVRRRTKADEALKATLHEDMASLTNSITIEAKARWREDAEVADAMSAYVDRLQDSLRVVNSDIV